MRIWPQPPQRFRWVSDGPTWRLHPSPITVQPDGLLWTIYVHDRPVHARYSNPMAAKRDAWLFAVKNCKAIFGSYRIALED